MERVGHLYEDGTYYISALIMAGEIIREATELLIPRLAATRSDTGGGKMVIATVRGDIHDIGKNIVIALLDAEGLTMVDLGVNVAPEQIAEAVERERPDVLGLSCLLTSGYEALRETIELVREQSEAWHPHLPIVLGAPPSTRWSRSGSAPTPGASTRPAGLGVVQVAACLAGLRHPGPPRETAGVLTDPRRRHRSGPESGSARSSASPGASSDLRAVLLAGVDHGLHALGLGRVDDDARAQDEPAVAGARPPCSWRT